MTTSTNPDGHEFVRALLSWLEDREGAETDIDRWLKVLSHHRRRRILSVVYSFDEAVTLADVADEVAIRETGRPLVDISAEYIARIYVTLYHDHLPTVVDAGLLQYDQERDIVAPPDTVISLPG